MVKEFRCRRFGRLHWLLRLVAVCAVLSLGLTYATTAGTFDWGVETIGAIMVVMQVALIVLITPSLAAALISVEREHGGWLLLQTTPLSIRQIIWGKLLRRLLPLMLMLCATMPGYLVMVYIEPGMELQVKRVVICLGVTAFSPCCSVPPSAAFVRNGGGHRHCLWSSARPSAVCRCWSGWDAMLRLDMTPSNPRCRFSSIAAAFSVIRMPGFQIYDLIPVNWWILGGLSVASLLVLLVRTYRLSRPQ